MGRKLKRSKTVLYYLFTFTHACTHGYFRLVEIDPMGCVICAIPAFIITVCFIRKVDLANVYTWHLTNSKKIIVIK